MVTQGGLASMSRFEPRFLVQAASANRSYCFPIAER